MTTIPHTRADILAVVTELLADIVDEPTLSLTEETTADAVPEWDSINHVKLLIALESEMGFRFETAEISDLKDIGQLIDVIEKKAHR